MREPTFRSTLSTVFIWVLSICCFLKTKKEQPQQNDNNSNTQNRNDFYQTFFFCCNLLAIGFSMFTIHMMIKRLLKSSSCNFINSYTTNLATNTRELENIPWKQQSNDKMKIQQDKLKHITKKHPLVLHVLYLVRVCVCIICACIR